MIPKKLHYVWVGDYENIPDIEKKWRKTTEETHPDYEIKVWSEKDIPTNGFLENCMKEKLYWAVSDYIRTYVLYTEGGFYIDTDVELINPIPKEWRKFDLILPRETDYYISNYFIGAIKNSRFLKKLLEIYNRVENDDTIVVQNWVPPKLWASPFEDTYGKYSIRENEDGRYKPTNKVKLLSFNEACPFYPWDKNRIDEKVDTEDSICVHYWNNYMKTNGLELGTFNTKYFDE